MAPRMSPHRLPLYALVVLCASLVLGGCSLTSPRGYFSTVNEEVRQAAWIRAPSGPSVTGPMVAARRWAVEASGTTYGVADPEASADGAAPDQWTICARGSARVSYAPREGTELGLSVEGALAAWSAPTATTSALAPPRSDAVYLGGGLQARQRLLGDARLGLGLLGEFEVASVGYVRTVQSTTSASYSPSGFNLDGLPSMALPPPRTTTEGPMVGHALVVTPRLGLFAAGMLGGVHLTGGLLAQMQPYVPGRERFSTSVQCGDAGYAPDSNTVGCLDAPRTGDARERSPISYGFMATAFVGFAYSLGPLTLFAQLHANLPDPVGLSERSRWGSTGGLRFTL